MHKKGRMLREKEPLAAAARGVSYLLIVLPVVLACLFVYLYGVNVVFWDEWAIADKLDRILDGTLGISDLFLSSFDGGNPGLHTIFFPQVAMLLLAAATKFNTLVAMYVILACFLGTLVCLWLVFRDSIRPRLSFVGSLLFVPVAFLVFSLRQHENMLWGFQITLAFAQVFSVLAFYLLHTSGRSGSARLGKGAFAAALLSGAVAAFSAAPGLFVWPAGLVQTLIAPAGRSAKLLRAGVWGLAGAGVWFVFFLNYAAPNKHGLSELLKRPMRELESFLILAGRPLFGQESLALVCGVLLVALAAVVAPLLLYRDRDWDGYSFWLALLLFSFLVMAAITVGRSGPTALQSRYVSFSLLAVVGVYALLAKSLIARRTYAVAALLGILSVVILASIPASYFEGLQVGRTTGGDLVRFQKTTLYRERAAFILATYESQPEEFLGALNPKPDLARDTAPALERRGYNVFAEPRPQALPPPLSELSPVPSSTLYGVESVSGVEVGQENQPILIPENESFIEVTGWAVDAEAEEAAGGVYLDIDGKLFPAFYGTDKSGSDTQALADRFGVPAYRHAVFERAIPVSEIGAGTHKLSVMVLTNDEEGYYRPDQTVTFEVR